MKRILNPIIYDSARELIESITPGRILAAIIFVVLAVAYLYALPDQLPPGHP